MIIEVWYWRTKCAYPAVIRAAIPFAKNCGVNRIVAILSSKHGNIILIINDIINIGIVTNPILNTEYAPLPNRIPMRP
jgi:hypothetical protein